MKTCPKCNSRAIIDLYNNFYYVKCSKCGYYPQEGTFWCYTIFGAKSYWNKRV